MNPVFRTDRGRDMRTRLQRRLNSLVDTITGKKTQVSITGVTGGQTDSESKVAIADPTNLVKLGMSEDAAVATSVVTTVHEAAHIKYKSDTSLLKKVITKVAKNNPKDAEIAKNVINVAEDARIDARMSEERPGYGEMLRQSVDEFSRRFYKPSGDRKFDTLRAAMIKHYTGRDLGWGHIDPSELAVIEDMIKQAVEAETSREAIKIAHRTFRKLWRSKKEEQQGEDSSANSSDQGSSSSVSDDSQGRRSPTEGDAGDSKGDSSSDDQEGGDSEKQQNGGGSGQVGDFDEEIDKEFAEAEASPDTGDYGQIDQQEHSLTQMAGEEARNSIVHEAQEYKSIMDEIAEVERFRSSYREEDDELRKANDEASTDVHEGHRAFYYKRNLELNYGTERSQNLMRQIASALKDELRKARAIDQTLRRSGERVAGGKVWRATKLHRDDVMLKKQHNSSGGWHVDVWVDGSGSNYAQVGMLNELLHALAGGLLESGMTCRVFRWSSDGVAHHIDRLLRMGEPITKLRKFKADDDNRDGFLVRIARRLLRNVNAEHKMLVWISDGQPSSTSYVATRLGGIVSYMGMVGAMDTGIEIRETRRHFPVLGLYVTNNPTVYGGIGIARIIYGNDFATIDSGNPDAFRYVAAQVRSWLTRNIRGR